MPFVHPGSLAKQKVKSRQRASHVETDGAYIAHFTVHGGSRGLLEEHQGMALPRFPRLEGRYAEGTYYPCLLPATLFGFTVDSVWVFELYPKGPDRTTLVATSLFSREQVRGPTSRRRPSTTTSGVDTIVPEDNEAVERQQEGLCLPVGLSGKFTHMETLCHAFDNWVLDRMVDVSERQYEAAQLSFRQSAVELGSRAETRTRIDRGLPIESRKPQKR